MRSEAAPAGGFLFARPFGALLIVAALGALVILVRFLFGLGTVSAMNDGYPWGLWIAFDVVTGTALACGGYVLALLVYIFNRGRYHPLVRSAILTSALGYSIAGFSVVLDIGRWWSVWRVPLFFWRWNLSSVLLEVALCIMAYVVVLWIELSPAFFEKGLSAPWPRVRRLSARALPILDRALIWIVALGILLPTMHQSSLGSLMLIAGPRLHPLWQTPLLPLLFLVSVVGMGYGAVILESTLSARYFGRRSETPMLAGLAGAIVPITIAFVALRLADLAWRGRLGLLFAFTPESLLTLSECALFLAPAFMLAPRARRLEPGRLFRAAMLFVLAGGLYRFDTYLVAFKPGANWSYFPSVGEILVTVGLVAAEITVYIVVVREFPILAGVPPGDAAPPAARGRMHAAGAAG